MKSVFPFAVIMLVLGLSSLRAEVVAYPAPDGEASSSAYEIWADGKKVDVYSARVLDAPWSGKGWDYGGPYSFANFDMSGPATVRITAKRSLQNVVIRPKVAGVDIVSKSDHELVLSLDGPHKVSVEPDGKKGPLLLFANPLETDSPKAGDSQVIYFGPGVHTPGRIDVAGGQTLYIAGGAVVKGNVTAKGDNIRILGRGILDGSEYAWGTGPCEHTLVIQGNHVEVNGITIRGSSHWTIVPRNSQYVTIRNVKLCNSRVQNDDGINPCNSQDVLITDCFIRSDDDCVAMKGFYPSTGNNNVERITVENSTLWCDRARIFLLGHESRAPFMRDIQLRNLDIIHFAMTAFLFEPGEEMRLENVAVENVRVYGEGQAELVRLKPTVNEYMKVQVPGFVSNVAFRNVEVNGKPGPYRVQLFGADEKHTVRGIALENVLLLGDRITRGSAALEMGDHVEDIRFGAKGE